MRVKTNEKMCGLANQWRDEETVANRTKRTAKKIS